jgi:hypothetical protein
MLAELRLSQFLLIASLADPTADCNVILAGTALIHAAALRRNLSFK